RPPRTGAPRCLSARRVRAGRDWPALEILQRPHRAMTGRDRSITLEAYGVRVAVRASSPSLLPAVARSLSWCKESVLQAALAGPDGKPPLPVALVVITKFMKDAAWRPRAQSRGAAVMALLDNTVSARRSPERAIGTLQKLVASAEVLKSPRGEAARTAET